MRFTVLHILVFVLGFQSLCAAAITPVELGLEISDKILKVQEFKLLREFAERKNLRIWLFGGSAAGFGNYVRWDLERARGVSPFEADRFDYEFPSIFQSTQDVDLAVSGGSENALAVEEFVRENISFFLGDKKKWEVRLLEEERNGILGLRQDGEFFKQNTDSQSLGFIEITRPANQERAVRDLQDWGNKSPIFLQELAEAKISFLQRKSHLQSKRYLEGLNPPIFSVIRYLTKVFQYNLQMTKADFMVIQRIIQNFKPEKDLQSNYARSWIEKNARKLATNAMDVGRAFKIMDQLKLRKKLISIRKDQEVIGTMAYWLSKKPMKRFKIGKGNGRKISSLAKSWGLPIDQLILTHDTSDYLAYEAITRSPSANPNVFVSRNRPGESANYGEGYYMLVGERGARNSGYSIRHRPHPDSRIGSDFKIVRSGILWLNSASLKVLPQSERMGLGEYFEYLSQEGELNSNRAAVDRLRRRALKADPEAVEEIQRALRVLFNVLKSDNHYIKKLILKEWASFDTFQYDAAVVQALVQNPETGLLDQLTENLTEFMKARKFQAQHLSRKHELVALISLILENYQGTLFWNRQASPWVHQGLLKFLNSDFVQDYLSLLPDQFATLGWRIIERHKSDGRLALLKALMTRPEWRIPSWEEMVLQIVLEEVLPDKLSAPNIDEEISKTTMSSFSRLYFEYLDQSITEMSKLRPQGKDLDALNQFMEFGKLKLGFDRLVAFIDQRSMSPFLRRELDARKTKMTSLTRNLCMRTTASLAKRRR